MDYNDYIKIQQQMAMQQAHQLSPWGGLGALGALGYPSQQPAAPKEVKEDPALLLLEDE